MRNQIRQMRCKDLRQYLVAKKVSIKGCVEKEDLVHLLMLFANGTDPCSSTDYSTRTQNAAEEQLSENMPNVSTANDEAHEDEQAQAQAQAQARSEDVEMAEEASESSESSPIISVPLSDSESPEEGPTKSSNDTRVEIQEVSETDSSPVEPHNAAEPLITEHEEVSEASNDGKKSDMVTEIPTWSDKVQLSDIKEASELEYLNVKQLKNLLSTNRVDYKGCLERQELLNRVTRLWQEYKQSRQDVEKLSEEELCKICWDAPIECVILECGHMACCINCGKQMSECPICKQYVVRVVRFFKA